MLRKLLLVKAEVIGHKVDDARDILPRDAVRFVTLLVITRPANVKPVRSTYKLGVEILKHLCKGLRILERGILDQTR